MLATYVIGVKWVSFCVREPLQLDLSIFKMMFSVAYISKNRKRIPRRKVCHDGKIGRERDNQSLRLLDKNVCILLGANRNHLAAADAAWKQAKMTLCSKACFHGHELIHHV